MIQKLVKDPDAKISDLAAFQSRDSVVVIASVNNDEGTAVLTGDSVYATTDQSQLLPGIGSRTRTVVFERCDITTF